MPRIFSPAARQTADGANRHVLIAKDLAAQPDARQASRRQYVAFGDSHVVRLAVEELDAACRAARVPATGVQLINSRILLKSQNEPLAMRYFVLTYSVNRELRHECVSSRGSGKAAALFHARLWTGSSRGIARKLAGYGQAGNGRERELLSRTSGDVTQVSHG